MTSQMPEMLEYAAAKDAGINANELVIDGSKVLYWRDRVEAWKRGEKIVPITVDLSWTRRCNAACHFCSASFAANKAEDKITQQNALDLIDDLADLGVKGISLISDGESTIVPWYVESIEYAHSRGLAIGVGSNGIKLTKPVLERILPKISYLRFNFSAGEKKRYAEIMGVPQHFYDVVLQNARDGMEIIRRDNLGCALNLQMVCDPRDADQIIPFATLCADVKPVYGVIKHCADNKTGDLGVDYSKYAALEEAFKQAEKIGRDAGVRIAVKWNRIKDEGKRSYNRCVGPQFILQISGSGLIAPCTALFSERYKAFHIGHITRQRFRDIFNSKRYDDVMTYLGSNFFDPRERCGPSCLANSVNETLHSHSLGMIDYPTSPPPPHLEFI